MNLALASDHAGYEMKVKLMSYLKEKGHNLVDLGAFSSESADYPDFGHAIAQHISDNKSDFGISLCGSGNGINMTANKHPQIRSALCWNAEISRLARAHNNANICAIPARFVSFEEAVEIVTLFLSTSFDGGRHKTRIDKIPL
ncbi:MAG: ribose 5-phosphate isomerase B [Bacteroidales bacterium]|nr:ribose 5-phosphate isomerase B [Bacteroidales bacterium]